jgi:hypothetical protein
MFVRMCVQRCERVVLGNVRFIRVIKIIRVIRVIRTIEKSRAIRIRTLGMQGEERVLGLSGTEGEKEGN